MSISISQRFINIWRRQPNTLIEKHTDAKYHAPAFEQSRNWFRSILSDSNQKQLSALYAFVERANELESCLQTVTDDELRSRTFEFKRKIDRALAGVEHKTLIPEDQPRMPGQLYTLADRVMDELLEKLLPEAFAVVREASKRILGMRHFDVQLLGGAAMHFNKISEIRTGEGKTLVATLPTYLNALAGRGAHVVTVNDYLAKRDADWMGQLYRFLGLSVGLVSSRQPEDDKYQAYRADITYGTNHEFGFDYLRDNMRTSVSQLVQRPYYFALVDEVDNILIDEARTPLIISGFPTESFNDVYTAMAKIAPSLQRGASKDDECCDYWVDEKGREVLLTEQGVVNAEKLLGVADLFDMHYNFAHHLTQALKAKELYKRETDYLICPNDAGQLEVTIIDEFRGRPMAGRRWADGLHQAIEAKEDVPIQEESLTYASITYQNLFRLYPKLCGMTGTAMTEAGEFNKIYNLDVVSIPTNKANVRQDCHDVIYQTELQKFFAVVEEIVEMHQKGRPVLVGTTSIEKSELVSDLLSRPEKMRESLLFKIGRALDLMSKHKVQPELVEAFRRSSDCRREIAMAPLEAVCKRIEAEYSRNQELIERCHSVLRAAITVEAIRQGITYNVLNAKHHESEAMIVAQAGCKSAITVATNMAGRGTDILLGGNPEYLAKQKLNQKNFTPENNGVDEEELRALVEQFKGRCAEEHEEVVRLGGLHIIGTERHESRRIDNQLRGRAGRQGDPGSTRFFISLEDKLMRVFSGEKIARLLDFIRVDDDVPLEAKVITKSIETVQKKVEAHYFDVRKHVLKYDDVLNRQREVIYRERRHVLERADLKTDMLNFLDDHLDTVLSSQSEPDGSTEAWEETVLPALLRALQTDIPILNEISPQIFAGLSFDELRNMLSNEIKAAYERREQQLGAEVMRALEQLVLLRTIDRKWVDYLYNMDILRAGIHLRSFGQRDPLQEYQREAFDMFNKLLQSIQQEAIQLIFNAEPEMLDMVGTPEESDALEELASSVESEAQQSLSQLTDLVGATGTVHVTVSWT